MSGLRGEKLLQAWELTRELPEQEAVLALLALAWPHRDRQQWAEMPLGERNAHLLELRAATMGRRLDAVAECPECGALLEFTVEAIELASRLREQLAVEVENKAGRARPATTEDLMAAAAAGNAEQARAILLARTVIGRSAEECDAGGVAVLEEFEQINAAAEIRVEVQCTECPTRQVMDLDIAQFLLREIAGAARRLMTDIHELASAYGWSERDIANMSAGRRAAYLEMLGV